VFKNGDIVNKVSKYFDYLRVRYVRKIGKDSDYLKSQSQKYFGKACLSFLFFVIAFGLTSFCILFRTQGIGVVEVVGFVATLIGLLMFRYYQRKYHIYKSGRQGEKTVISTLTRSLSDDYYLINGVYLKEGGGDIDHVIVGPSGVYVLETKNWGGTIICNGDKWQRPGKTVIGSPSLQVKHNVQRIKKIVDVSSVFMGYGVYVKGIIVFTNVHVVLRISNSSVTVLRLSQLVSYIKNQENNCLTRVQIQKIVEQIQKVA